MVLSQNDLLNLSDAPPINLEASIILSKVFIWVLNFPLRRAEHRRKGQPERSACLSGASCAERALSEKRRAALRAASYGRFLLVTFLIRTRKVTRTHLKKVFWPKLGVGRSVQVLEIRQYSSGLNLAAALILNQNPFFEIGSRYFKRLYDSQALL